MLKKTWLLGGRRRFLIGASGRARYFLSKMTSITGSTSSNYLTQKKILLSELDIFELVKENKCGMVIRVDERGVETLIGYGMPHQSRNMVKLVNIVVQHIWQL
jgi:hypothetical protein